MKHKCALTPLLLVLLTCILITGCNQEPGRLFEHSPGLDALSRAGDTTILDMEQSRAGMSVTVLETYYNSSAIYVGYVVTGQDQFDYHTVCTWRIDGQIIGDGGSHGAVVEMPDSSPGRRYFIMSLSAAQAEIAALPDEFTLEFTVFEQEGEKREVTFELPLKRGEKEVVIEPKQ